VDYKTDDHDLVRLPTTSSRQEKPTRQLFGAVLSNAGPLGNIKAAMTKQVGVLINPTTSSNPRDAVLVHRHNVSGKPTYIHTVLICS
jgi:hypothetical protein